jgi:integrase/recombinase XerC
MSTATNITWSDAIEGFVRQLVEVERSAATIRTYRHQLGAFAAWYRSNYPDELSPANIAAFDLRNYKAWLKDTKRVKASSVNTALSALASFLRWTGTAGISEPIQVPKQVRRARPGPRWLTSREQLRLLKAVDGHPRDRAITIILLRTGLRIGEFAGLLTADIHNGPRKGHAIVRGKGGKEREVPLSKDARDAFCDLARLGGGGGPTDHILMGQRGPLGVRALEKILEPYARKAGLEGFHPHILRHTCARRLIEAGMPIQTVAAILGHDRLDTTRLYCESSPEDLQRAVDSLDGPAD